MDERLNNLYAKAQKQPGTRIKIAAGDYLYCPPGRRHAFRIRHGNYNRGRYTWNCSNIYGDALFRVMRVLDKNAR